MGLVGRLRAWRRYRRMSARLAELDRHDRKAAPQRNATPLASRPRLISNSVLIYALSFVAIVGLLLYVGSAFPWLAGKPSQQPPAAHLSVPSTATTGPFAFLATTPAGRPVTYDPCHPIHYVVNPAAMPLGAMRVIRDAIRTISTATKLKFIDDGLTQEPPNLTNRPPSQPQRYGQRWAPVLIAWTDQAPYPMVGGDIAGIGGSTTFEPDGPESARYVTGEIALNQADFTQILTRDGGDAEARAIVMHELGHVVGLGHVTDPRELMAPKETGQTALGPGDRQGLATVGAGPCWPDT